MVTESTSPTLRRESGALSASTTWPELTSGLTVHAPPLVSDENAGCAAVEVSGSSCPPIRTRT